MLIRGVKKWALFSIFFYIFLIMLRFTGADIFAERIVRENKFRAITLDFTTGASYNNFAIADLFRTTGIVPGGYDLGAVRVGGITPFYSRYNLKVVKISGDDNFCNALKLEIINRNFSKKYDGDLLDLSLNSNLSEDSLQDWIFVVSFDDDDPLLMNKICDFNLELRTYREDPDETGGIFAERKIRNIISSGSW